MSTHAPTMAHDDAADDVGYATIRGMEFTAVDRTVMSASTVFVDGLADYLGAGYEIVLHSLEDLECSVIHIVNGHYSGRTVGAPITDLALTMLSEIRQSGVNEGHISYFVVDKRGERLKSTTITIAGEDSRVIGLICINFYLSTPVSSIIENLVEGKQSPMRAESFVDSAETLILETLGAIQQKVLDDNGIAFAHKNREVIGELEARGIFGLKNSVALVAEALSISKSTVYLHLRRLEGETRV
ncbi:transcriptional regulator [Microbacterium sp. SSM24]|uniref:helix-turn-helix transcriptional regulator n=1 Tax=Microbacterium sp. SSM24 TaxID=2991714 RepID=UPI002225C49E|nr:PAS domain-containing protein [Microbacterium sp. SSM24]MCW3492606.1 PAS domain-containing protein [Microbacterium sp. SSM24]